MVDFVQVDLEAMSFHPAPTTYETSQLSVTKSQLKIAPKTMHICTTYTDNFSNQTIRLRALDSNLWLNPLQ